jgi:uncharacterized membrane protein required for colicin V production
MGLDKLPINLFDIIVILTLAVGLFQGRKHGMSEELVGLIKWLTIIAACTMLYYPLGEWLASSSPFSRLASFMFVYAGVALLILSLFGLAKHYLGGKLVGSDVFGRTEYYLGMGSGVIRFSCMLIAVLALLHARHYSSTEVRAMERFQNEMYGSNYFPTWQSTQRMVFENSFCGSWIKNHLSFLLIKPTQPESKQLHQKEFGLP